MNRMLALAGLTLLVAAGFATFNSESLLSRDFGSALATSRPGLTLSSQPAGDGFWLSRTEVESPTPFGKPLSIGARITITGIGGHEQQLEVVDLKALNTNITRVGTSAAQPRLVLVTCRLVGKSDEGPVRFLIEADEEEAVLSAPRTDKAL
jgi:hypothetical protein